MLAGVSVLLLLPEWEAGNWRSLSAPIGCSNREGGTRMRIHLRIWWLLVAVPTACCLVLSFPKISQAHAMLVRSDPTPGSVVTTAPQQVRLWFSEALNPATSTAYVVHAANSSLQATANPHLHVDAGDAHIDSTDNEEMDLTFKAPLSPDIYVVIYRTQSAEDGHVVHGSFIFTVAEPDGVAPRYSGALPDQLSSSDGSNGQIDGLTLLNLLMVTLVDLGAVFWLGAQCWHNFVWRISEDPDQLPLYQQVERRFERVFAIPTLLLLLFANGGVLIAEALSLTSYQSGPALTPNLFSGLITQGQFGPFWVMREVVVLLALVLALYLFFSRQRPAWVNALHPWLNLLLGLALITAMTLSGNASTVSKALVTYAVLADWLHLLAAALWVGGIFYIALVYLPAIQSLDLGKYAYSLITTLALYTPLAATGFVVLAASGPFSAAVHMDSGTQLFATAYGRTLLVKSMLVVAMLLTSAVALFGLCPRLKKCYLAYAQAQQELADLQGNGDASQSLDVPAQKSKRSEEDVRQQAGQLTRLLRWGTLPGVAILLCSALLNLFAGTLQPAIGAPASTSAQSALPATHAGKPFTTTLQTQDKAFTVKLSISPNTFGANVFTVSVFDSHGKPATNVAVLLYTSSLDMDMGIDKITLQPDGKGHFRANGDITMPGNWEVRVEIRAPNNTLHEGTARFYTPDASS
jgi:copper transport protein